MRDEGFDGPAPGLYMPNGVDYGSPPDFDVRKLTGLGFSYSEIRECENLFQRGAKFSTAFLQQVCGYDYSTSVRLKYLYDIAQGKIEIETDDELCRHLKKLFGNRRRASIADIPPSAVTEVPKLCLIGNVVDELFYVYNSAFYSPDERFYKVVKSTNSKTVIRTSRKPEIKFRGATDSAGVASILCTNADGTVDVQFESLYVRLCNRYIVIVSAKRPEFHLGCYELIVVDGSRFYVFARVLPAKSDLKYKAAQERVLDSGVFPDEIKARITKCALWVHKRLSGVKAAYIEPTSVFELMHSESADYDDASDDEADSSHDSMDV
jgi:hypothetical protein